MRSWASWLVMAVAIAALGGCANKGPQGWSRMTHDDVLQGAGLKYYWKVAIDLPRGESIEEIYRLDENIYCITNRNRMICVDANIGVFKWSFDVAPPSHKVYRPCHADRADLSRGLVGVKEIMDPETAVRVTIRPVMINTYNRLYVLDRDTGEIWREIHLDFPANTAGASDGEYLYVGGADARYHSVNLQVGQPTWALSTEGMMIAPISVYGGRVYAAGTNGRIYAATSGTIKAERSWSRLLGGAVNAGMSVSEKGCFVPCLDKRLYAFDPATGMDLAGWDAPFSCDAQLVHPPQVTGASVFQYAAGDRFYAISLADGKKRWDSVTARAVLAAFDQDIYLLDEANNLQVVDELKGAAKVRIPLAGFDRYVANTAVPAIYAASHDGYIACIRPLTAESLAPEMMAPTQPAK